MKAVLVTTEYRGVFFGYIKKEPSTLPGEIKLTDARGCVYWSSDCHGFLGLASSGPTKSCRIGPKVPEITLYKVTSLVEVTPEAAKKWEDGPWS